MTDIDPELAATIEGKADDILAAVMAKHWRLIETAPTGRSVWIGFRNPLGKWRTIKAVHHAQFSVEYDGDAFDWADEKDEVMYCPAGWYEDLYSEVDDCTYIRLDVDPTHWMPLPEPPTSTDK